jgi:hypothetical protein
VFADGAEVFAVVDALKVAMESLLGSKSTPLRDFMIGKVESDSL